MAISETAREFSASVIAPQLSAWEAAGRIPDAAFAAAGERGLCRLTVPVEHGGHGLCTVDSAAVFEEIAGTCFATAVALGVHNNVAALVARFASAALRSERLPALLDGSRVGAFLVTEPAGGSDPASMRSTAEPDEGGGWRLNGEKAWIANAAFASELSVFARGDPTGTGHGIACYLLDAETLGVTRTPSYRLMGGHALGTAGFRFDAAPIEPGARLVEPGQGLRAALAGIDRARVHVAAMCCGALASGIRTALAAAHGRSAFGRPVLGFQGLQWLLAEAETDLRAARLLVEDAARRLDRGDAAAVAAAHAKKFASRVAFTRLADCMQVMGADGFSADYPLARHLAGAKMSHYLDGTSEIQNIVIARSLLGDSPD